MVSRSFKKIIFYLQFVKMTVVVTVTENSYLDDNVWNPYHIIEDL